MHCHMNVKKACKFLKKLIPTQNTSFQGISKHNLIQGHFENMMHYFTALEIFTIHALE
jgi:hypothetical protein